MDILKLFKKKNVKKGNDLVLEEVKMNIVEKPTAKSTNPNHRR